MTEQHKHYNLLKESGDLEEIMLNYTGVWEKDRVEFNQMFSDNVEALLEAEGTIDLDD